MMSEGDLYAPIKRFLEGQGYEVKGEIGPCDIVAVRADEDPVVVELKNTLSLTLLLQGVDRLGATSAVYVAFRVGRGASSSWRSKRKQVLALLRRLGLRLLTVSAHGNVTPVLDPTPYRPRQNPRRKARLLKEFAERVGDPETGGTSTRKRLTAYRQDALRCARALSQAGVLKVSDISGQTGVSRAGPILRDNHYGWFERARRGHYELSPKGKQELPTWAAAMAAL